MLALGRRRAQLGWDGAWRERGCSGGAIRRRSFRCCDWRGAGRWLPICLEQPWRTGLIKLDSRTARGANWSLGVPDADVHFEGHRAGRIVRGGGRRKTSPKRS